jgi:hypothetical protein
MGSREHVGVDEVTSVVLPLFSSLLAMFDLRSH